MTIVGSAPAEMMAGFMQPEVEGSSIVRAVFFSSKCISLSWLHCAPVSSRARLLVDFDPLR